MVKQWKKDDFKVKYIKFDNEKQFEAIKKFLTNLGLKFDDEGMVDNFIYCSFDGNFWRTTYTSYPNYTFEDLNLDSPTISNNFEKGRWYKENTNCFYIKFERTDNLFGSPRIYGERISNGIYEKNSYWSNETFQKQALQNGYLTDLSEIQDFLPVGHSDKLPISPSIKDNLVKGKYYSYIAGDGQERTFQFDSYTNDEKVNATYYNWKQGNLEIKDKITKLYGVKESKNLREISEQEAKGISIDSNNIEKMEFKKDDYIIQLTPTNSEYLKQNHVYKQNSNHNYLFTDKDSIGSSTSSSYVFFNKPETWRYATLEEIAEYNRIGKPFDVTTLKSEKMETLEYYEMASDFKSYGYEKGIIYQSIGNSFTNKGCVILLNNTGDKKDFNTHWLKPSTKEAFDLQNKPKEESLVGRHLKALKDSPQSIGELNKGDYFIITRDENGNYNGLGDIVKESSWKTGWSWNKAAIGYSWELMPIGFTPPSPITDKYVYGVDPVESIEVGDIVEVVEVYSKGTEAKVGGKYELIKKDTSKIPYLVKVSEGDVAWCTEVKLVKKASNYQLYTTTNYNYIPKDDNSSPKVAIANTLIDITIPKSRSVTLKNTEREVKIKINKPKQVKIN